MNFSERYTSQLEQSELVKWVQPLEPFADRPIQAHTTIIFPFRDADRRNKAIFLPWLKSALSVPYFKDKPIQIMIGDTTPNASCKVDLEEFENNLTNETVSVKTFYFNKDTSKVDCLNTGLTAALGERICMLDPNKLAVIPDSDNFPPDIHAIEKLNQEIDQGAHLAASRYINYPGQTPMTWPGGAALIGIRDAVYSHKLPFVLGDDLFTGLIVEALKLNFVSSRQVVIKNEKAFNSNYNNYMQSLARWYGPILFQLQHTHFLRGNQVLRLTPPLSWYQEFLDCLNAPQVHKIGIYDALRELNKLSNEKVADLVRDPKMCTWKV